MKLLNMLVYNYYITNPEYRISGDKWDGIVNRLKRKYKLDMPSVNNSFLGFERPELNEDGLLTESFIHSVLIKEVLKEGDISDKNLYIDYLGVGEIWNSLLPEQRLIADAFRRHFLSYEEDLVGEDIEIKRGLKRVTRTYEIVDICLKDRFTDLVFKSIDYVDGGSRRYSVTVSRKDSPMGMGIVEGSKEITIAVADYLNKCFEVSHVD